MEIRNLQTFLQVASTMNITRASNILGYSQSSVSAQIQQLEAELDRIEEELENRFLQALRERAFALND